MPRARDEPVRLTRIYTRGGDAGRRRSATVRGRRSSTPGSRPSAPSTAERHAGGRPCGRSPVGDPTGPRARAERALRPRGGSVGPGARRGRLRVAQKMVDRLEEDCDRFNADLPELGSFVLPGGAEAASRLHVARTICRRAERNAPGRGSARARTAGRRLPQPPFGSSSSSPVPPTRSPGATSLSGSPGATRD